MSEEQKDTQLNSASGVPIKNMQHLIGLYKQGLLDEHMEKTFKSAGAVSKKDKVPKPVKVRAMGARQMQSALIQVLANDDVQGLEALRSEQARWFIQDPRWAQEGLWGNGLRIEEDVNVSLWSACVQHGALRCMQHLLSQGFDPKKAALSAWLARPMREQVGKSIGARGWRYGPEGVATRTGQSRDKIQKQMVQQAQESMEQLQGAVQRFCAGAQQGVSEPMVYADGKGSVREVSDPIHSDAIPALLAIVPKRWGLMDLGLDTIIGSESWWSDSKQSAQSNGLTQEQLKQKVAALVFKVAGSAYVDQALMECAWYDPGIEQVEKYFGGVLGLEQAQNMVHHWRARAQSSKEQEMGFDVAKLSSDQACVWVLNKMAQNYLSQYRYDESKKIVWFEKVLEQYAALRQVGLEQPGQDKHNWLLLDRKLERDVTLSEQEVGQMRQLLGGVQEHVARLQKDGHKVIWISVVDRLPQKLLVEWIERKPNDQNGTVRLVEKLIQYGYPVHDEPVDVPNESVLWRQLSDVQEDEVPRVTQCSKSLPLSAYALALGQLGLAKVLLCDPQLREGMMNDDNAKTVLSRLNPIKEEQTIKALQQWALPVQALVDPVTGNGLYHHWVQSHSSADTIDSDFYKLKSIPKELFWLKNNAGQCAYAMMALGQKQLSVVSRMEQEHIKDSLREQKVQTVVGEDGSREQQVVRRLKTLESKKKGFGKSL